MELDEPSIPFTPAIDRRPTLPEPPPVRLVAVEDVTLTARSKVLGQLDSFYVGMLRFERDAKETQIVYRAENARLRFVVVEEPPDPNEIRILGIEVPSLRLIESQLVDRKIDYAKEKSITLGRVDFLLQDPVGNWLRISEAGPLSPTHR